MENKRIILGLDVSTTTIGICLMVCNDDSNNNEIVKLTHVKPKIAEHIKGIEGLFLKKRIFENEFLQEYKDYGIDEVIIEEPLLGSNNIHTVATLLKFNILIADSIFTMLGIVPELISSYDSRAYAFPELVAKRRFDKKGNPYSETKIKGNKPVLFGEFPWDIDKKQIILDKVSENFPKIEWIYNKKGELKKESFDSSDAVCCILGFLGLEKNPKPIIIKEKKSKKKK